MDSLVLDIGGTVGALVIHAGPELAEQEIEISPTGSDVHREHNVVHARRDGHRTSYTAVFPSVPAGRYTVWSSDGNPGAVVTIQGGEVTEHHL
jgi:fatty acid/phospholipid biosynthesis enzyme